MSTNFQPNVHPNAYRDYYTGALNRYLENMYEIQGLTYRAIVDGEIRKDMHGELFNYQNSWMIDTHSSEFVIYTGETKTVVFRRCRFMLVCDGGMLYDMITD